MRRHVIVVGLAAGAMLAMGCSVHWGTRGDPAPAPIVSGDPAETAKAVDSLRSGTKFVDQLSFRTDVDISGQITTLSHTDNVKKRSQSTVASSGKVFNEVRMIDDDVYLKASILKGVGDVWLTLDPAKVPASFALSFAQGKNDPGGSARLIDAIVSARVSGSDITGTMDLTRVGTGNGISFKPPANGGFPETTRSQPFRATLDSESRLITFIILDEHDSSIASLRYSEFGIAVAVEAPAGAVPAPDGVYPQLGV